MTDATVTKATPRRLSVLAGLVTVIAGAMRYLVGKPELYRLTRLFGEAREGVLLTIVWHSLTYFLFVFGIAMIVTAWGHRSAARIAAAMSAAAFGGVVIIMGAAAAATQGNPFAFYPIFVLGTVAILSAIAAIRA